MPRRVNLVSPAYRSGGMNPQGKRNFLNRTKVYTFRTMGRLECNDYTNAYVNTYYFPITCVNDPMGAPPNFGTAVSLDADADNENINRHPQFHDTAITDGYDVYQVLSSVYSLNIQCQTSDSNDVIVAWCFQRAGSDSDPVAQTPVQHKELADFNTEALKDDLWYAVRNNGGWAFARFSGTQTGGTPYPSQGVIRIPIPSVAKLGDALWRQYSDGTTEIGNAVLDDHDSAYKGVLADTDYITNGEVGRYFLCLYVFKAGPSSSQVLNDDRISVEVTIDQKTKLWRNTASASTQSDGNLFDIVDRHDN